MAVGESQFVTAGVGRSQPSSPIWVRNQNLKGSTQLTASITTEIMNREIVVGLPHEQQANNRRKISRPVNDCGFPINRTRTRATPEQMRWWITGIIDDGADLRALHINGTNWK